MKYWIKIILIACLPFSVAAQPQNPDSLIRALKAAKSDSARFNINMDLSYYYEEMITDSSIYFTHQAFLIAQRNNHEQDEAVALNSKGYGLLTLGKYREALTCLLQAHEFLEKPGDENVHWHSGRRLLTLSENHHMFGNLMIATENTEQAIFHFKEAVRIGEEIRDSFRINIGNESIITEYVTLGKFDSALIFAKRAQEIPLPETKKKYGGWIFLDLGNIYFKLGNPTLAKQKYYEGLMISVKYNNQLTLCDIYDALAKLYLSENQKDSSLYYARQTVDHVSILSYKADIANNMGTAYENLYLSYKLNNQFDSAFKYQGLALIVKDSLYKIRIKNLADFQNLSFSEELRLQNLEKEKAAYEDKIRTYALLSGIVIFMLIAFLLFRNNRSRRKANDLLQTQKKEIELQKKNVEQTLVELKSTQSQLIQSEKMASLGELTAGIAHEIQNPLNFVNNFSEVSKELLDEMKTELDNGNADDAKEIANDVIQNLEKINHHGKRADAIVKGMLQHSQASTGKKEPTNINALADEYLRLAYQGLRAKEKEFNATLKTDFDESIRSINIIPQDIGRVLLNLYNNAFYAVNEKKKSGIENYEPTVSLTTKKLNGKVEISVADNGSGIPQKIVDKIFQPFFTTKPTGQGTGLGLSLSYDIVKAHGGEIKVETKVGEGAEFIITLPQ